MATPEQARAELAKRELVRRGATDGMDPVEIKRIQKIFEKQTAAQQQTVPMSIAHEQGVQAQKLLDEEQKIFLAEQQGVPIQRHKSGAPAEFSDFGSRFSISKADNPEEIKLRLKEKFPDLEIVDLDIPINDDPKSGIAVRFPGDDQYKLLDSKSLATLGDLADAGFVFSGETLGTIIATIATQGRNLPAKMLSQFAGASLGRAIDETSESIQGLQTDPIDDVFFFQVVPSGVGAAAFEPLSAPATATLNKLVNSVLGKGTVKLLAEQEVAIKEFIDSGVGLPTIGTLKPALSSAEQQAILTSKRAEDFVLNMEKRALQNLKDVRDLIQASDELTDAQLDEAGQIATQALKNIVLLSSRKDISTESGGRALQSARKVFKGVWKKRLDSRYNAAFAEGRGARFDISNVKKKASEIKKGVTGRKTIIDTEDIPGGTSQGGEQFVPIGSGPKVKEVPVQLQKINSELKSVIKDIEDLDSLISIFQGNEALEQIKTLRTRLFDLKNATVDGKETIQNRFAGQLWDELTKVMDDPIGGGDRLRVLLKAANNTNRRFERILEVADIARVARETEPGRLTELVQPGKSFTLRTMQRLFPEERWNKFRESYRNRLIQSRPQDIIKALDDFNKDPQTLDLMLTKFEQKSLRNLAVKTQELENVLGTVSTTKLGKNKRIRSLIDNGDNNVISNLIKQNGGKESDFGRSMRRGIYNKIIEDASKIQKGVEGLNANKAITVIENLRKSGVLDTVLTPAEVEALKNKELMYSLFPPPVDSGAGIQAAEIGAKLASIFSPEIFIRPFHTIARFGSGVSDVTRNFIFGTIMMSDTMRKLIIGNGAKINLQEGNAFTTMRVLTALTGEAIAEAKAEEIKEEMNDG